MYADFVKMIPSTDETFQQIDLGTGTVKHYLQLAGEMTVRRHRAKLFSSCASF